MKAPAQLYEQALSYHIKKYNKKLIYIEMGEGEETLMFLHGMGSNLKAWYKNMIPLQEQYRCIALDFPGYGKSERLDKAFTIEKARDVVIEFISVNNIQKLSLVGHSMGGQIAIAVGHARPDLVENLILVAPAGIEKFSESEIELISKFFTAELIASYPSSMIEKNYKLNFYNMPDDARFMIEDRQAFRKKPEAYLSFCEVVAESTQSIVGANVLNLLKELKQKTLIVYGTEDKLIPHHIVHPGKKTKDVGELALNELKNGRLIMFEECGHFLQWEKAEKFNRDLREFLKST